MLQLYKYRYRCWILNLILISYYSTAVLTVWVPEGTKFSTAVPGYLSLFATVKFGKCSDMTFTVVDVEAGGAHRYSYMRNIIWSILEYSCTSIQLWRVGARSPRLYAPPVVNFQRGELPTRPPLALAHVTVASTFDGMADYCRNLIISPRGTKFSMAF
jgi:hypothetical protein